MRGSGKKGRVDRYVCPTTNWVLGGFERSGRLDQKGGGERVVIEIENLEKREREKRIRYSLVLGTG